jgi:hypothetical protein
MFCQRMSRPKRRVRGGDVAAFGPGHDLADVAGNDTGDELVGDSTGGQVALHAPRIPDRAGYPPHHE